MVVYALKHCTSQQQRMRKFIFQIDVFEQKLCNKTT